jgi:hypothetical protein
MVKGDLTYNKYQKALFPTMYESPLKKFGKPLCNCQPVLQNWLWDVQLAELGKG